MMGLLRFFAAYKSISGQDCLNSMEKSGFCHQWVQCSPKIPIQLHIRYFWGGEGGGQDSVPSEWTKPVIRVLQGFPNVHDFHQKIMILHPCISN